MTVYVDEIRDYGEIARLRRLPGTLWAHLTADTHAELHAFAARLGLRRAWFQDHPTRWHYDVTPGKRGQALRLGAVALDQTAMGELFIARRATPAPARPGPSAPL